MIVRELKRGVSEEMMGEYRRKTMKTSTAKPSTL